MVPSKKIVATLLLNSTLLTPLSPVYASGKKGVMEMESQAPFQAQQGQQNQLRPQMLQTRLGGNVWTTVMLFIPVNEWPQIISCLNRGNWMNDGDRTVFVNNGQDVNNVRILINERPIIAEQNGNHMLIRNEGINIQMAFPMASDATRIRLLQHPFLVSLLIAAHGNNDAAGTRLALGLQNQPLGQGIPDIHLIPLLPLFNQAGVPTYPFLTEAATSAISPVELSGVSPDIFQTFRENQIRALTVEQIQALRAEQIQALTAVQIQNLRPDRIRYFEERIGVLAPQQIQVLTFFQIQALTLQQIQAFTPQQIQALTADQTADLRTCQIQSFSIEQIQALRPQQIRALTFWQIPALRTEQIEALRADQIKALRTEQIQALTRDQVGVLSAEQIQDFTREQLEAMTVYQIGSMHEDQVQRLAVQHLSVEARNYLRQHRSQHMTLAQRAYLILGEVRWWWSTRKEL